MSTADLTPEETKTVQYYNENAKQWLDNLVVGKDSFLLEPELCKFQELLPAGKILEVGCGAGNDAKWLINNKYNYTGIDISSEMVDYCKKKIPTGNFSEMSVYELDFADGDFDGFWTSITLLHIPKNKISNALNELKRVMKTGGIGFISMKKGTGEKFEDKKKRFYAYYTEDEFADILKTNGFEVMESYDKSLGKTEFLIYFIKALHE